MSDGNGQAISGEARIRILLAEYAALRLEMRARATTRHLYVAAGAAALVWLVVRESGSWVLPGIFITLVLVCSMCTRLTRNINAIARRVRELETEINVRAGERLLVWETERSEELAGLSWESLQVRSPHRREMAGRVKRINLL
jgi:hypothetical protein